MIESTLFKDIEIVTPNGVHQGDLLIKEGKIAAIEPVINETAEEVIQETGLTILPGVIDPHVHFRDPGATHKEDLESGSKAAASGGVTSFFDMPNTNPATISVEAMQAKKDYASTTSLVNYNFFIGATADNLRELQDVENVPGIKIYVGSSTGSLLVDQDEILDQIFRDTSKLIAVHSEDEAMIQEKMKEFKGSTNVLDHEKIRSAEGALKCTQFLCELALKHKHRLHICHLTTKQEVEYLKSLGKQPFISTEVTPQHLLTYSPDIFERWGTKAQINPPIRSRDHQEALFKGLKEGVIACIGSDHAPHLASEKAKPFGQAPSGMPGVETSLPVFLNLVDQGYFSLQDCVRLMSFMPAQLFKVKNKGQLTVGYDADCVVIDRKGKHQIDQSSLVTKAKWSVFEGLTLTGKPIATFVNGQCVYREGSFFTDVKGTEIRIETY